MEYYGKDDGGNLVIWYGIAVIVTHLQKKDGVEVVIGEYYSKYEILT